jgi:uncharacterized protein YgiM (DUF1202 family)
LPKNRWLRYLSYLAALALIITLFPANTHAAAFPDYKIEVNKTTNKLYLYQNGKVIKVYPVATGRSRSLTPEGTFPIVVKIVNPGWKNIPGGRPDNPLGVRWNGISVNGDRGRTYGIHGTNNPSSIGKHVSHGCIRMYNKDVIALYNTIYEGTPVWIHSGQSDNHWRGDSRVGLKPASGTATITGQNVNARTGPSTGAFVLATLKKGTHLALTGISGDWYQVKLPNGRYGFVYKPYVQVSGVHSEPSPAPEPQFYSASGQIAITVNKANIRAYPSLHSSILTQASAGTKFGLTAVSSEWYQVRLNNGKTAYVHHSVAKVVSLASPSASKLTVTVHLANIRSAPSLSASVLQLVSRGTTLTKTGAVGDFFQIRLKSGQIAYIHKSCVK